MKQQPTIQIKHTSIWLFSILTTSSRTEVYHVAFFQPMLLLMQNRLQFLFHTPPFYPFFLPAKILLMQKQLEPTIYLCSCPAKKCPIISFIRVPLSKAFKHVVLAAHRFARAK